MILGQPTHLFLLTFYTRVEVESLGYGLSVDTPTGVSMEAFERVKDCHLRVLNHTMDVTLIVLDMTNFDVVLGMKWLAKNHAFIDCFNKEVVLRPPGQPSFKFKGTRVEMVPEIVLALKARKMLSQGAWGILVSRSCRPGRIAHGRMPMTSQTLVMSFHSSVFTFVVLGRMTPKKYHV